MLRSPTLCIPILFALTFSATLRGQAPTAPAASGIALKWLGEIHVSNPEDPVVQAFKHYATQFIDAGVKDGEPENWACRAFLTKSSLAALPMHFRIFQESKTKNSNNYVLLHWDYAKAIQVPEMFSPMRASTFAEPDYFEVKRMLLHPVARPGGGFRINFGPKALFGEQPTEHKFLRDYQNPEVRIPHKGVMARLRQLPIYASINLGLVMPARETKEIHAIFGPKSTLLSAGIFKLGNRPALEVFSATGPGQGVVGQYLSKKAGQARILGSLPFEPSAIFSVALSSQFSRGMRTLSNMAPAEMKSAIEPVQEFLDSWTGSLTLALSAPPPAPGKSTEGPVEKVFEPFVMKAHGTVIFEVEDESGADLVKSFEAFCATDLAKGMQIVPEGEGATRTFRIQGIRSIAFGTRDNLLAISVGTTAEECIALRKACLAKQSPIPMPPKFGLVQGPVKLWIRKGMQRYYSEAYRAVKRMFGDPQELAREILILDIVENELFQADWALSLSWTRRLGVMLRAML